MIDIKQIEGDVDLSTGDIVYANTYDSTEQHKADILISAPGDYAESPLIGAALVSYINAESSGDMLRNITVAMRIDGINIARIGFDVDGLLIIDGSYEDDKN